MANNFTRFVANNIGTTPVALYTAPASTQTTCIGLSVSNTSAQSISITITVTASATAYNLVRNAIVPVGGSLSLFGSDGKLVLNAADVLSINSSVATSADAILSVLQITP